jgi:serine/threonine-protein kinase HipA
MSSACCAYTAATSPGPCRFGIPACPASRSSLRYIERYDRSPDTPEGRIHQEDFNQVLGASGNPKYQKHGGRVSLGRIAHVFSAAGDNDSLKRLFKLVVLSVAVGNLDMHAKNISLLHRPDGEMTLSPAYDVVPQAHQHNGGEVALAIGGEYRHAVITMGHLVAEGQAWGLTEVADLAEETVSSVLQLAQTEMPDKRAYSGLANDIVGFSSNLLAGHPAGATRETERTSGETHPRLGTS